VWFPATPKQVSIIRDADLQVRRVSSRMCRIRPIRSRPGTASFGHYEGDTLVIDTIGLNTKTFVDAYALPHREAARGRALADGRRPPGHGGDLQVEDPDTYYEPMVRCVTLPARAKAVH
jgi:hypothetical protein